jgi:glyoxylate reductase
LKACGAFGVRVVNTPHVLSRSTAELSLALLLAAARRFPEGEKLCRQGEFKGWTPQMLLGLELKNRNAVLVGRGRIGKETAKLYRALGIRITWITRFDSTTRINQKLRKAQILSLHFPLTSKTHHWLDHKRLKLLPRDCIVINTSRGSTIDEKALIQALKTRKIFAAGLDVFEKEPEIPASLRKLPNVVLLPHIGSATLEARAAMARLVIKGVLGILGGKHPPNEVMFRLENK